MAKYDITAPDGHTYEVEAPDNAPESAVLAYAKANYTKMPPPVMQNLGSPKEAMAAELATRSMPERALAGVGTFMNEAAGRAKQLFGNKLTPQETADIQSGRDMTGMDTAALAGNIGGSVMATGYPGAALYRGVAGLAGRTLPKILAPTAGGATAGAITAGATQPVLGDETTAGNMGMGALGGALGDSVARVGARVAQPILQSPAVQNLLSKGIVPTPGQAAGGLANRLEQKLESVPGPGDIVRMGRDRASKEFNKATLNSAMPEGKVTQIGQHGMDEVNAAMSSAYDKVFAGKQVMPNMALGAAIAQAKQVPTLPLNQASRDTFDSVIQKVFAERIPQGGRMDAASVKAEIVGDLGKVAARFQKATDAHQQALGDALMAARNTVNDWLKNEVAKTSPLAAGQIAHIDKTFANKVSVAKAVEKAKAANGVMTPFQLQGATKDGQPLRAFANDAQEVLGNRVPNSGTIDRGAVLAALGIGGGGVANDYFGGPGYLTALAASPLLYSRAGSRYMVGNLPWQGVLAELARKSAPYASVAGSAGTKK